MTPMLYGATISLLATMSSEQLAIHSLIKLTLLVAVTSCHLYILHAELQALTLAWIYFGAILILFLTNQSTISPISSSIKPLQTPSSGHMLPLLGAIFLGTLLATVDPSSVLVVNTDPSKDTVTISTSLALLNIIYGLLLEQSQLTVLIA